MTKKYPNEYCFLSIFFIFSPPKLGFLGSKQEQLAYFTWVSQRLNLSRPNGALTSVHASPHLIRIALPPFPFTFFLGHNTTYTPLQRFIYEHG